MYVQYVGLSHRNKFDMNQGLVAALLIGILVFYVVEQGCCDLGYTQALLNHECPTATICVYGTLICLALVAVQNSNLRLDVTEDDKQTLFITSLLLGFCTLSMFHESDWVREALKKWVQVPQGGRWFKAQREERQPRLGVPATTLVASLRPADDQRLRQGGEEGATVEIRRHTVNEEIVIVKRPKEKEARTEKPEALPPPPPPPPRQASEDLDTSVRTQLEILPGPPENTTKEGEEKGGASDGELQEAVDKRTAASDDTYATVKSSNLKEEEADAGGPKVVGVKVEGIGRKHRAAHEEACYYGQRKEDTLQTVPDIKEHGPRGHWRSDQVAKRTEVSSLRTADGRSLSAEDRRRQEQEERIWAKRDMGDPGDAGREDVSWCNCKHSTVVIVHRHSDEAPPVNVFVPTNSSPQPCCSSPLLCHASSSPAPQGGSLTTSASSGEHTRLKRIKAKAMNYLAVLGRKWKESAKGYWGKSGGKAGGIAKVHKLLLRQTKEENCNSVGADQCVQTLYKSFLVLIICFNLYNVASELAGVPLFARGLIILRELTGMII